MTDTTTPGGDAAAGNRKTGWIDTRHQVGMLHVKITAGQVRRVLLVARHEFGIG